MFPLTANEPYIKETGERSTLGDMFENSGGGGGYVLPSATASRLGGVKIGSGVNVAEDGTISVPSGSITVLCQPTVVNSDSTITLSDDYTNYDFLMITCVVVSKGVNYHETSFYPTLILSQGERIGIQDDTSYTWLTITGLRSLSYGSGEYGRTFVIWGIKL